MVKVITYGTFDLLHQGHLNLLKRAKALGDYLIVGVTADDFDKVRGKINVKQSLIERLEAVKSTGIADEIIVEEYEGQKIDDIKRYGIDIFTVGSDWKGYFDYLSNYTKVIYLDRTPGISSSELRSKQRFIRLGLIGYESKSLSKFVKECKYVNGVKIIGICTENPEALSSDLKEEYRITNDYDELLSWVDAVYIISVPNMHYFHVKHAIECKKHVLCEAPLSLNSSGCSELFLLAKKNDVILFDAIKTAYSTAYNRLLLLAQSGKIGSIKTISVTCTSLQDNIYNTLDNVSDIWSSITAWGPTALLPVFHLMGVDFTDIQIISHMIKDTDFDLFTNIRLVYPKCVADIKVGKGIKSENSLVISGTKGYIYVPSPWWKTDYFELRTENQQDNKRYFYQLEGEGIRYEIVDFINAIEKQDKNFYITSIISNAICGIMEQFYKKNRIEI